MAIPNCPPHKPKHEGTSTAQQPLQVSMPLPYFLIKTLTATCLFQTEYTKERAIGVISNLLYKANNLGYSKEHLRTETHEVEFHDTHLFNLFQTEGNWRGLRDGPWN